MSSSMLTFALLRDSSDLHIYKDLYGERNKPESDLAQFRFQRFLLYIYLFSVKIYIEKKPLEPKLR